MRTCTVVSRRSRAVHALSVAILLGAAASFGCQNPVPEDDCELPPCDDDCPVDGNDDAITAAPVTVDPSDTPSATEKICPSGDRDWYSFELSSSAPILGVQLTSTRRSPVRATYNVYREVDGAPESSPSISPPITANLAETISYCLGAGRYYVEVRDDNDDDQDFRNPYELVLTSFEQTDPDEPNGTRTEAGALTPGMPVSATIGCRGDEDWYAVDVTEGQFITVELTQDPAPMNIAFQVFVVDETVALFSAMAARREIEVRLVDGRRAPITGRVFVRVFDQGDGAEAGGFDAAPDDPYTLTVRLLDDTDPHEPNDHATEATWLPGSSSPVVCGASGASFSLSGTILEGNYDWFRINLDASCGGGVLEADLDVMVPVAEVPGQLAVIRPDQDTPCTSDSTCTTLSAHTCAAESQVVDCEYLDSLCSSGNCKGAEACVPALTGGTFCGAVQVNRSPGVIDPAMGADNHSRVSMPIHPLDRALYVRVSSLGNRSGTPDTHYQLNVRVRTEPDANEPNNIFRSRPEVSLPFLGNIERSTSISVQPSGACAGGSGWITGYISYEDDLDFYRFEHPCPGADCRLRMHFEVDPGPVTVAANLHPYAYLRPAGGSESGPVYENPVGGVSLVTGTGTRGDGPTECLAASAIHMSSLAGDPARYYLVVGDECEGGACTVQTRNSSTTQRYRMCLEIASSDCSAPCEVSTDGTCRR